MQYLQAILSRLDKTLTVIVVGLLILSIVVLRSIAPHIFPNYYFIVGVSFVLYVVLTLVPYEVYEVFSPYFYIGSVLILLVTVVLGQVTRGTVRWISFAGFRIQPSEVIRPLLFLYFSFFFTKHSLQFKSIAKSFLLFAIPFFLILIQPSLTVAVITAVGFLGILISVGFNKKLLISSFLIGLIMLPIIYFFLAPYQKQRITTFLNPTLDPYGSGYNTIQSVITVGSGGMFGKGLGKGSQTQLSFLPERHTDFFFASLAEEMGFVGSILVILLLAFLLIRITVFIKRPVSASSRAFLTAVFFSLLIQITINIGMNLGITPVAGVPLPLLSAGGSSMLATLITLGISQTARKL